jgi:hypothetical protein
VSLDAVQFMYRGRQGGGGERPAPLRARPPLILLQAAAFSAYRPPFTHTGFLTAFFSTQPDKPVFSGWRFCKTNTNHANSLPTDGALMIGSDLTHMYSIVSDFVLFPYILNLLSVYKHVLGVNRRQEGGE